MGNFRHHRIIITLLVMGFVLSVNAGDGKPLKKNKAVNEWILLDANNDQVGEFINFLDGHVVLIKLTIENRDVLVKFMPFEFLWIEATAVLLFEAEDCSGQPYAIGWQTRFNAQHSWRSWIGTTAIIAIENNEENIRLLYAQIGPREVKSWGSMLDFTGICLPQVGGNSMNTHVGPTTSAFPVEPLGVDIFELYPPPYTLEKRASRFPE